MYKSPELPLFSSGIMNTSIYMQKIELLFPAVPNSRVLNFAGDPNNCFLGLYLIYPKWKAKAFFLTVIYDGDTELKPWSR